MCLKKKTQKIFINICWHVGSVHGHMFCGIFRVPIKKDDTYVRFQTAFILTNMKSCCSGSG